MLTDTGNPQLPPIDPTAGDSADPFTGFVDSYNVVDTHKYFLPDGKQFLEFRSMNEGERSKYEGKTSRDITFNRRTDDAAIKVNPSQDRHALITTCVTGWYIARKDKNDQWQLVPFSKGSPGSELEKWLQATDPKIVNDLVDAIRKANPWMMEDMTVKMIDEEIERLQALRTAAAEREAQGKSS